MTFPQIPNTVHQVFLLLSFIFFFAFAYTDRENKVATEKEIERYNISNNNYFEKDKNLLNSAEIVFRKMRRLAVANNLSAYLAKDSIYYYMFDVDSIPKELLDTVYALNQESRALSYDKILNDMSNKGNDKTYKLRGEIFATSRDITTNYFRIGGFCLIAGLFMLTRKNKEEEAIRRHELGIEKIGAGKRCQSCGRKFNSMIVKGTNTDNSVNEFFCSECYVNGQFTDISATKQAMIQKAIANQVPPISDSKKKSIEKLISSLDRWNKDKY